MGTSSSQQTQSSVTSPWAPAQPALQGILGQLQGLTPQTGLTPIQSNALSTIEKNASSTPDWSQPVNGYVSSLLGGGGALSQSPAINNAFQRYTAQTNPLASNTDYNPLNTPGLKDSLNYLSNNISTGINGQFAAAGRDMSPANSQALAYGLTSGLAPILTSQYNQNVSNQQGAAGNLYNAGVSNAGILSGLQQQYLANQGAGVSSIPGAAGAINNAASTLFSAGGQPFQTQAQNLGLLSQIGIPIAGLGGQSTGTASGSQTASPIQDFGMLFGGSGGGAVGNALKLFSDRRLKQDIQQVGTLFDGTPVYRYLYNGAYQIGLMADEIEKHTPNAIGTPGLLGFKMVDYKLATDRALEAA